ncbi:MAG: sulfur carrier protein ThiS [Sphingobacteriaceae bacterium]|nr:sulfur carrier protein ThiS [Sphingobacteriaceae bacterium]
MEISLNNEKLLITQPELIYLLQQVVGDKINGMAVAVNQQVIKKSEWNTFQLKENDHVLFIKATQGG